MCKYYNMCVKLQTTEESEVQTHLGLNIVQKDLWLPIYIDVLLTTVHKLEQLSTECLNTDTPFIESLCSSLNNTVGLDNKVAEYATHTPRLSYLVTKDTMQIIQIT